jgi:cytoskeletal protein CcmA (bactofilin family)
LACRNAALAPNTEEPGVSYFSAKNDRQDVRAAKIDPAPIPSARPVSDQISTIGGGMVVTGNIVCAGALQIFGRVTGDIHAARLTVCEGARVEGKIIAPETVIQGAFQGTVHGNAVKLQSTAVVEGEIFNKTLAIEENARFEGVSRRLDQAIDAPSLTRAERAPATAPRIVDADASVLQLDGASAIPG